MDSHPDYFLILTGTIVIVVTGFAFATALLQNVRRERAIRALEEEVSRRKSIDQKLKASLREKDILLQEIHHRVANNMQLISSLLNLQSRTIKGKAANEAFLEAKHRIDIMALIYQQLYQTEDLSQINLKHHMQALVSYLQTSFGSEASALTFKVTAEDIPFALNIIIPISLIITELVTNAIKYAFESRSEGKICISLEAVNRNRYELVISDDGVGLPAEINLDDSDTLGLRLTKLLVRQLGGTLEVSRTPGTEFKITWTEKQLAEV
ncbi:MAG: histidine kinase dimerization/phosphoacceptor domain -containing protein [Candidatus Neomarinimicrobiota bacterium]